MMISTYWSGQSDIPDYQEDTIRVDFHPHSGRPTEYYEFEKFNQINGKVEGVSHSTLSEDEICKPFRTRGDFTFASLALDAALNNEQIDAFINLLHDVASGKLVFTIKNHADLAKTWKLAEPVCTGVSLSCTLYLKDLMGLK